MTLFLLTLLILAAVFFLERTADRGGGEATDVRRLVLVAVVVLLPALYAALVLFSSRARLEALQLTYAGKILAYNADIPLSAGSSTADADAYEDLHAVRIGPGALTLGPAGDAAADLDGVEPGDPVIRLASPSPIVRVDGVAQNSYALADGDRILLKAGEEPLELVYDGGELRRGERTYALPGTFKLLLRGPSQVFYFPDLLARLAPEAAAGTFRSLLHRPSARSAWHLLIREREVEVHREGEVAAAFRDAVAVPTDFELRFQIVWGSTDLRNLRTVRSDRLILHGEGGEDGRVEVRFGEPQRRVLRLDTGPGGRKDPLELGVVVPNTVDRRDQLIELEDYSARFRGLAASLFYDPAEDKATLGYLSDRVEVDFGDLYALGEGADQMLLRLDRTEFPGFLLFDLALLALFSAVFLGRSLLQSRALLVILAPVGLLLACRLLFAFRAANHPPDFFVTGYGEARLALWLVPAAILLGWSLAWLLRRPVTGQWRLISLRWPLLGLGIAGLGCLLSTLGMRNLPWLAFAPWLGALVLVAVHLLSGAPRVADRLRRWQGEGLPWAYRWLAVCGVAVLAVRGAAATVGMQETLRLPAIQFRLLWTVLQLPFCALVVALTLHLVDERRRKVLGGQVALSGVLRHWLAGIGAVGLFLALAFLGVAVIANDTGLVIAHSLAAVFGLLLLVSWPRPLRRAEPRAKAAYGAGIALACLPLAAMLAINTAPEQVVRAADWVGSVATGEKADEDEARQVVDRRAQLLSIRSQRLFRLYMLGNPALLQDVGLQPSERVAIHYATLQSYAEEAGFRGGGFASAQLPRHLGITYLSDLVPMVFVLADFGVLGIFALAFVYLSILAAVVLCFGVGFTNGGRGDRLGSQGAWIAAVALLAFVLPSLYMILANLNLVLFTGKNCNLLSLNSISDVLESAGLLGLAAFGVGLRKG